METQRDGTLFLHRVHGAFRQTHEKTSACLRATEQCDFRS